MSLPSSDLFVGFFRLLKLQECLGFLWFLMKCMPTLLLGVTLMCQWEHLGRLLLLSHLDPYQRDGLFLVGDLVGLWPMILMASSTNPGFSLLFLSSTQNFTFSGYITSWFDVLAVLINWNLYLCCLSSQVVESIVSSLNISSDPATFIQVCDFFQVDNSNTDSCCQSNILG